MSTTGNNAALSLLLALCAGAALADQYHSEGRVASPQQQQAPPDLRKQEQNASDPYEKELLLRDLAMRAADSKDYKAAADYMDQALALHALSDVAEEQMRDDLTQLRIGGGDAKTIISTIEPQYRAGTTLPPEQLVALGAAYLQEKRYADALPPLQAGIAAVHAPDVSWRRVLYAAFLGNGREHDAAQVLESIVRDQPDAADTANDWLHVCALYMHSGDKLRAQAAMSVAARLGYLDKPAQRLQLIALTAQVGAPFEAGSLLHDWLAGSQLPRNADNLRMLAALWVQAREASLAIPALEDALRAQPGSELYLQLGQLHLDREEYREAAQALAQGIATGGKSGPASMALGMALYQQADIDGALHAFRDAGTYPASRDLAGQWVAYLESGKAREQALAAAATQRSRDDTASMLVGGLLGQSVDGPAGEPRPATPPAVSPAAASGNGGFTPVGAEQAGNVAGTIPPWTGGLTRSQWPAAYKPGDRLLDPFPNDQPQFTITAANVATFAAQLAEGQKALFAKYPDYVMHVYPTRRTVAYPQAIDAATQANIGKARTIAADSIADAHLGFPFARPQTGVEILWNHRLRYRGDTVEAQSTQAVVWPDGTIDERKQTERVFYRYGNVADPVDIAQHNILLYYFSWFSKARGAADYVLVHETANQLKEARAIWVIPDGVPRMLRVPPVGYDQPFPGSSGLCFVDMVDMYNGLFDRYVWKLIGKREIYIPYNDYRVGDGSMHYAQLLTPNHFNQAPVRYELHRVWVVEATLRPGNDHRFGKRVFYVDEDSWNIVLVDNYDHDGRLWRYQEGHLLPDYSIGAATSAPALTYDLKDGRYFASHLFAEDPPPRYNLPMNDSDFSAATVQARYVR